MRLGKRERKALRLKEGAKRAVEARKARVEALPRSDLHTCMEAFETHIYVGKGVHWEFDEKLDRRMRYRKARKA